MPSSKKSKIESINSKGLTSGNQEFESLDFNTIKQILKNIKFGVWDWDIAKNKLVWDETMYSLYGVNAKDFKGTFDAWESVVSPADAEKANLTVREALDGNMPFDTEFRINRADTKETRLIRAKGVVERDKSGAPVRFTGINWDITGYDSTRDTIGTYESLFHQVKVGIYVYQLEDFTDPTSFRLKFVNPATKIFTGFGIEEIIGKKILDIFPGTKIYNDFYRAVLEEKSIDLGTVEYVFPDSRGKQFFDVNCFSLGRGSVGVLFTNTTEKVLAQKELERGRAQVVNSAKMASLGQMASGVAHEINNPLTIIVGKVNVLRHVVSSGQVTPEVITATLDKIEQTCFRVSKIIKGLKMFSGSSERESSSEVALLNVINDVLSFSREKIMTAGIDINIEVEPNLKINCRPVQISQVLLNLISNSHDAVRGLEVRKINIKAFDQGKFVKIDFIDSGKGIPPEVANRLMEPFFTTKEVGKGTGLGLSISKGIIEDHGGKIWYDAEQPNTCFSILLPKTAKE